MEQNKDGNIKQYVSINKQDLDINCHFLQLLLIRIKINVLNVHTIVSGQGIPKNSKVFSSRENYLFVLKVIYLYSVYIYTTT